MSVLFLPPPSASAVPDASETVSGKIRIATSTEATTGTNDLTAMTPAKVKTVVDAAVVGGVTYQGTFDPSSPVDLSAAEKGDLYIISVAGTYQGITWAVGDHLLVNADMGGSISPSKIDKVDNTDAVTSVAGRTGAVTLSASDVSGLAAVATSGAYSDLSGTPTLAAVATSGAYSDLSGTPTNVSTFTNDAGYITSAPVDSVAGKTGAVTLDLDDLSDVTIASVSAGETIVYNGTLSAFQNAALATVATTGAYSDLSGTPTLAAVATSGAYSDLSGTPSLAAVATSGAYSDLSGTPTLAAVATSGAYSDLSGTPTLGTAAAEDVGTSAGNVVQLDGTAKLPAVDGSQLTNLPSGASTLGALTDVDVTGVVDTNVIKYNSTSGNWEDGAVAYSEVTGTPTLGTAAAEDVGTAASNVVQLDGSARLPAVDGSQLTGLPSAGIPTVTSATPGATYSITTSTSLMEVYLLTPSVACAVTIPTASSAGSGYRYNIKNNSTYTITITPSSGTIDTAASFSLPVQFSNVTLVSDGSNWFVL